MILPKCHTSGVCATLSSQAFVCPAQEWHERIVGHMHVEDKQYVCKSLAARVAPETFARSNFSAVIDSESDIV